MVSWTLQPVIEPCCIAQLFYLSIIFSLLIQSINHPSPFLSHSLNLSSFTFSYIPSIIFHLLFLIHSINHPSPFLSHSLNISSFTFSYIPSIIFHLLLLIHSINLFSHKFHQSFYFLYISSIILHLLIRFICSYIHQSSFIFSYIPSIPEVINSRPPENPFTFSYASFINPSSSHSCYQSPFIVIF